MSKQTRIFSAVVAVLALAWPLAGCQSEKDTKPAEAPAQSAPVEAEEEEPEEEAVPDAEAAEVAEWFINAAKGDAEAWEAYQPDIEVENLVAAAQEQALLTLDAALDGPPTDEQKAEVEAAVTAGYARVEVALDKDEVNGNEATITWAVKGINADEGSDLAASSEEGKDIIMDSSATMDDFYMFLLTHKWSMAPLATEPIMVEIPLAFDDDTGKWTLDDQEAHTLGSLLSYAFTDNKEGYERLSEMLSDL